MSIEPDVAESLNEASILPFPKMSRSDRVDATAPANRPDLRSVLGEVLRTERLDQDRTLAAVAAEAHVSLAYLSEVERGLKDVSSELLGAVIDSLDLPLVIVLERCIDRLPALAADAGAQRGLNARLLAA